MSKIVILLYEHAQREIPFLQLLKKELDKHKIKSIILHFYLEAFVVKFLKPNLVLSPFFYSNTERLLVELIEKNVKIYNLAWEQIIYSLKLDSKLPRQSAIHQNVKHFAWGDEYYNRLISSGCNSTNIIRAGNYNRYLINNLNKKQSNLKKILGHKVGFDARKELIVIPENYSWAFMNKGKLNRFIKENKQGALNAVKTSTENFLDLVKNLSTLDQKFYSKYAVVFRPRPTTSIESVIKLLNEHCVKWPEQVTISKEFPFHYWACAADVVISSLSTTIVDTAILNKRVALLENVALDNSIKYDWMDKVCKIEEISTESIASIESPKLLNEWVVKNMPDRNSLAIVLDEILKGATPGVLNYLYIIPVLIILYLNLLYNFVFGRVITKKNKRSVNYFKDLSGVWNRVL